MNFECPECKKVFKRINEMHISTHGLTKKEFMLKYPNTFLSEGQIRDCNRQNLLKGEENIDFVVCPICNKKYKELNNDHLWYKHQITSIEFDKLYPNNKRISDLTVQKKDHFKNLTPEISKKLKKGHTIERYIEKYGTFEGMERFQQSKRNKSFGHTLSGYIQRYGEVKGTENFKACNESKKVDLKSFCRRYGEEEGFIKYLAYINKLSAIRQMFDGIERVKYKRYYQLVRKYTRISIRKFGLKDSEKQSRKWHVDHKYPIISGFLTGIHPVIIGSIFNLEMLSENENCTKKSNASIDINILIDQATKDSFYFKLIDLEKWSKNENEEEPNI